MNELLQLALNQRKIKQILNVIFVGSISSYLFEALFFEYSLIEIMDYTSIYAFLISGHFIIPFTIFYFIWILTIGIRIFLFELPNVFITKKFGTYITKFLIWYYTPSESKVSSSKVLPKSKSLESIIKAAPDGATKEDKLLRRTLQSHRDIESDYTLILRSFIAITIYFNHIEYFGWLTYTICIFVLLFMWLMKIVEYQLAEVIPSLIQGHIEKEISEKKN